MGAIEKNKNLFIITLDNGKQTHFDFADGQIYGVSGKAIKNFSSEARKVLKSAQDEDFLARYFIDRTDRYSITNSYHWSIAMVETVYSLFAKEYNVDILSRIAEYCFRSNYALDKKGVKVLKEALHSLEDEDGKISYLYSEDISRAVTHILYTGYSQDVTELINACKSPEIREIIVKDIEKIAFRYEHENWKALFARSTSEYYINNTVYDHVARYIQLCNILHKERTYKNLFLSICQMEQEKDLIADTLCEDYQKKAPLFFEDDNFTVIIPTTAQEFQNEADYQQNCVFRLYYPRVKEFQTHIVFIRRKDDVNTPYITCEVENDGNIKQYLTRFNYAVTDKDALTFRQKYQEFLLDNF